MAVLKRYSAGAWAPVGMGGIVQSTTAPASPVAGDLWLDTDEVVAQSGTYVAPFPDSVPASPNAKDDEFDGTSSVSWTQFGSPNTWNINSNVAGHAYLKASGSGATLVGVVQAVPAFPFTVTTKLKGTTRRKNYQRGGGLVFFAAGAISGSSAPVYYGPVYNTGFECNRISYSNLSSFGSQTIQIIGPMTPLYLRAIVNSATSVDLAFSNDGIGFVTLVAAYNPGFSIAQMGVAASEEAAGGVEAWFEWFRVS